jgi:acetyl-CoA carboxylase biotin carboxyl carrier protein
LTGVLVESPSVGLFWRSPSPGAPPFVDVGTRVAVEDTLAIVEVMKLMNHLVAPVSGTVNAILAENGARIEYGQPLVAIDPDE